MRPYDEFDNPSFQLTPSGIDAPRGSGTATPGSGAGTPGIGTATPGSGGGIDALSFSATVDAASKPTPRRRRSRAIEDTTPEE